MVTHPAHAARHRAAGRLWALLFFFLAAVLTLATAVGNATAATVSTTETRVGVSNPGTITAVGLAEHIGAGQHPVRAGPLQDLAQGHGVHDFYVIAGTTGVLVHNAGCNLPAWKKIGIDIDHIASGHMVGGSRTVGGAKDLFPRSMSRSQVAAAVRNAYRYGTRVRTQGERVLVRGKDGRLTIEMWVNTETREIETAYPVNR